MQVTFSEAAKVLGMKSRSTLYRLKDSELARYVRPPAHPGGAARLELEPDGLPSLRDWLDSVLQQQSKTPAEIPPLAFGAPAPAPAAAPVDPANVAQGLAQLVAGLPEDQIPNLATSRERRAHYLAEVARLDALTQRGELVAKAEVMAAAFAAVRQTRDMLLGIPSRVAPQMVGVSDTQTAYELLDKEIRYSLTALATALEVDENS